MRKKKSGFLGGTFDPIHLGHLNLAIQLQEKHHLDEVVFCPAYLSPEKTESPPTASTSDRLAMLSRALAPIPNFSILDWEVKKQKPSYTIETIRALKEKHPDTQWHLLLGEDLLGGLSEWKESESLLKLAPPLIGSRLGELTQLPVLPPELLALVQRGLTRISVMEISSTDLRMRLAKRRYCGHLIPSKVLDYITEQSIYE